MRRDSLLLRLPFGQFTPFQAAVHLGSLVPLALLVWDYFTDRLTVNPIQDITFRTGKPALVLLVLSLACTPLNTVFGFRSALRVRRALGLYAFAYVILHLLTFIGLDYGFDLDLLREAIFEKRYALIGFATFMILLPLALTSTRGWQKRLGRTWARLHRWVYLAGVLAVVHYVWVVKTDVREPLAYGAAVVLLLVLRLPVVRRRVRFHRPRWLQLPQKIASSGPPPPPPSRAEVLQDSGD